MMHNNESQNRHQRGHGANRGPRGFGPFGPGFGGPGGDPRQMFGPRGGFGPGFGTERRTPRGGIRLGLLALLSEGEQNGYGLMRSFGEKTSGNWAPKGGAVYPALNSLLADNLVSVNDEGIYSLTEGGRAEVTENKQQIATLFAQMGEEEASDLFTAGRSLFPALFQLHAQGTAEQREQVAKKVDDLRKEIYRVLGE